MGKITEECIVGPEATGLIDHPVNGNVYIENRDFDRRMDVHGRSEDAEAMTDEKEDAEVISMDVQDASRTAAVESSGRYETRSKTKCRK